MNRYIDNCRDPLGFEIILLALCLSCSLACFKLAWCDIRRGSHDIAILELYAGAVSVLLSLIVGGPLYFRSC